MMMKKLAVILFTVVYSVFSAGITVLTHTCGGESEAILVTSEASDPCWCAEDMSSASTISFEQQNMCCSIDLKTMQLDESQNQPVFSANEKLVAVAERPSSDVVSKTPRTLPFTFTSNSSPPPPKNFQAFTSIFLI